MFWWVWRGSWFFFSSFHRQFFFILLFGFDSFCVRTVYRSRFSFPLNDLLESFAFCALSHFILFLTLLYFEAMVINWQRWKWNKCAIFFFFLVVLNDRFIFVESVALLAQNVRRQLNLCLFRYILNLTQSK